MRDATWPAADSSHSATASVEANQPRRPVMMNMSMGRRWPKRAFRKASVLRKPKILAVTPAGSSGPYSRSSQLAVVPACVRPGMPCPALRCRSRNGIGTCNRSQLADLQRYSLRFLVFSEPAALNRPCCPGEGRLDQYARRYPDNARRYSTSRPSSRLAVHSDEIRSLAWGIPRWATRRPAHRRCVVSASTHGRDYTRRSP